MNLSTTLLSYLLLAAAPVAAASSIRAIDTCSSTKTAANTLQDKTIVETALGSKSFSTLVTALKAADLVAPLQAKGSFTVFAPTNEAFAKLPKKQLAMLLDPKNKNLLQSILTYHVVPGELMAKDVLKAKNAVTLNGQRIDISIAEGAVMTDGATVTSTDINCSNGVIHVIDRVIIPE